MDMVYSPSNTRSAAAKPASMSPSSWIVREATLLGWSANSPPVSMCRSSSSSGASGFMASRTSSSTGNSSYSTSINSRASWATCLLVAATAAIGWPSNSTLSRAMRLALL